MGIVQTVQTKRVVVVEQCMNVRSSLLHWELQVLIFLSWIPPQEDDLTLEDSGNNPLMSTKPSTDPNRMKQVVEKDRTNGSLSIPFVSKMASTLPPIQSLEEMTTADSISLENSILSEEHAVESS